jgi:DNA segregation ATPase FtsK/SpoIIIE, S-DNA-T family
MTAKPAARPGAGRHAAARHAAPEQGQSPQGISANVSLRFCLEVDGQVENDMVLGTSSYQNGLRATMFTPKLDAGIGILKGEHAEPKIVRSFYFAGRVRADRPTGAGHAGRRGHADRPRHR